MNLLGAISLVLAVAATGDGPAWNEGVDFYRAGDATNALRVLKPLMLSPTHGPRAAEVVAKLAYDAGDLETAAAAAQLALRAAPEDAKANRNFTRAVDRLPEKREEARLQRILQSAQGKDPGAMLLGGTHEARAVFAEAGTYRTNAAPRAVAAADRLAARMAKLADTWIPVKAAIETVAQSATNREQVALLVPRIDAAEKKTREAAEKLGDLDPDGYAAASEVENAFNAFAKMTALPPAAMDEDLLAQTNAWQDVETVNGRAWQPEALDWTRAFRARFPAWARAYDEQAKADTNKPPFTAEDQAKVSALATELEKLQISCTEKDLPPEQEKALRLIEQIRALLPKDRNGGGSSSQQNQQNRQPPDNKDQKQDQKDQQNQDQQNQDPQNQDQPQDRQEQDPNEQQQDDQKDAREDEQEQPEDREVEDVLKKAQERSDEHEADKKARMRKAPLPPNERDW